MSRRKRGVRLVEFVQATHFPSQTVYISSLGKEDTLGPRKELRIVRPVLLHTSKRFYRN